MQGKFITLEGGEGCGKSTQIRLLEKALAQKNISVVVTKEPGGTSEGAVLRNMLVTGDKDKFDAVTESLLYFADRRIHLQKVVLPSLNAGKWVISDRFADSTKAYQCYGYKTQIKEEIIDGLYKIVAGDFKPDLTVILDIDPYEGCKRSYLKSQTMQVKELRFESKDMSFHENLRQGFLQIARKEPSRCTIIDAGGSIESVHQKIMDVVKEKFGV